MKPAHALVACSLLGSLWIASCSDSSAKKVHGAGGASGEAGAAGEPSAAAGQGGRPAGGTGGASSGGEATAGQASAQGGASLAGQGGQGGQAPLCFDASALPAAGAPGFGEAGAGNTQHLVVSCNAMLAQLAPTYDPVAGKVTLDASTLGPAAAGDFTFYYYYSDPDAGSGYDCADAQVQVSGGQLTLPISVPHTLTQFYLPVLELRDQCGNVATLESADQAGFCFSLQFTSNVDADGGTVWQVDCMEGSCQPKCADRPPP